MTDMRFCRFCGTPTGWSSPPEAETEQFPPKTLTQERPPAPTQPVYLPPELPAPYTHSPIEPPRKRRWLWVVGSLFVSIMLALTLVNYGLYRRSQRERIHPITASGEEIPIPEETPTPPIPPPPPVQAPSPPVEAPAASPAPPPPSAGPDLEQPRRVSTRVLYANAIRRVPPEYPPIARRARVIGPVEVQVVIDEDGDVISATAISGHPLLREAAEDAARQWKFQPFLLHDEPIQVTGVLVFGGRVGRFERLRLH